MTQRNVGDIFRQISIKLEDIANKRFQPEYILTWMNEATNDVSRKGECLMTENSSTSVSAGTQQYLMPADVIRLHRVAFVPSGQTTEYDMQYMAYKNMSSIAWTGLRQSSGTPQIYYTWGFPPALNINLYPIPSQNGTLKIAYYRQAAPIITTNTADHSSITLDLPQGWEDLVIDYVVAEALMVDRDPRWQDYKAKYEEKLMALIDASDSFVDQAGSMVQGQALVPGWLYDPAWDSGW